MNDEWMRVDFLSGYVTWMENELQEDMLQVEYLNNYILDMGWYEDRYIISIIKDFEWGKPVARYMAQAADNLFELLAKAVGRIEQELKNQRHNTEKR